MGGRRGRSGRRAALIFAALVVAAVAFVAVQLAVHDRIASGVSVGGVGLQGHDRDRAADLLTRELWPRVSMVQLETGGGEPLTLSLTQLGMTLDASATAEAAYARGRHKLPFGVWVRLPGGGGEVDPVLEVDAARLEQGLASVREAVDVATLDARLKIEDGRVAVVPAKEGRVLEADALVRLVEASMRNGMPYRGPVPMMVAQPRVSTADAEARAGKSAVYLARPITLRHGDRRVVLAPEAIARLLSVNTREDAALHPLTFRNERAESALRSLLAWAERPPVDAKITVHTKGGITVTQSREGELVDLRFLLEDLDAAAVSGGLRTVIVPTSPAPPSLSSDDVRAMGLSSLGSQFTTYFDPGNATRAGNIALAAKLVDGTIVAAGETFSLNAAMGPRTVNRGFDHAPVIAADGVLRQGVGGGICQYATTLFNAVLYAGLPVVERRPHSLYIDHYPVGRDATVAWGSVDFKFRNDTGKSLLIRSWVEGDALKVAIVGKTGRKVQMTTSKFYDIRRPAHGRSDPRVIHDADLGPGVVRWERGVDGRSVRTQRTVRTASGKLLFKDTYVSRYEPLDWVKRVGTG